MPEEWSILLTVNCFSGVIAVFHIAVVGYIVDDYCLMFYRGVVHIVLAGYNVDHYCLRFERRVVHIVMAVILLTIPV